jgi:hypothetical protein
MRGSDNDEDGEGCRAPVRRWSVDREDRIMSSPNDRYFLMEPFSNSEDRRDYK